MKSDVCPRRRVYPKMRIEGGYGGREREDAVVVERGRDEEERKTRSLGFGGDERMRKTSGRDEDDEWPKETGKSEGGYRLES